MSISHVTTIRNAVANAACDAVDNGVTDANGDLVYMTAGEVAAATLACSNPAFAAPANGTKNANAVSDDTNAAGGVVALFKFQDRDNGEVYRGTMTAIGGGGDIEIANTTIPAGVTVSLTSFSYTAPV